MLRHLKKLHEACEKFNVARHIWEIICNLALQYGEYQLALQVMLYKNYFFDISFMPTQHLSPYFSLIIYHFHLPLLLLLTTREFHLLLHVTSSVLRRHSKFVFIPLQIWYFIFIISCPFVKNIYILRYFENYYINFIYRRLFIVSMSPSSFYSPRHHSPSPSYSTPSSLPSPPRLPHPSSPILPCSPSEHVHTPMLSCQLPILYIFLVFITCMFVSRKHLPLFVFTLLI